ncbi:MAG: sigma-70 family RNA polymerase sigma factor [Chloroflexi bacterium]|nr:sigma-70 family RNA polymerase sigma factor [Chloroflexota bacterium]
MQERAKAWPLNRLWRRHSRAGEPRPAPQPARDAVSPQTTAAAAPPADASEPAPFETAALEELDTLLRLARRLTHHAQDAEDLVQETYVKALRFKHTYTPGTNLRAWLCKILHNTYLNTYRQAQRVPATESFDALEALDAAGEYYLYNHLLAEQGGGAMLTTSAEEAALRRLGDDDVRTALDALPEAYRVLVVLCDVEGFTYREMAEVLDIPMGTVMSRLSRGRKQLQRLLWKRYAAGHA